MRNDGKKRFVARTFVRGCGPGKEQGSSQAAAGLPEDAEVRTIAFNLKAIEYEFRGECFRFGVPAMLLLAFVVGVIGGTYGIGGAIIAPFCVAVFRLPVYTVAGAALLGTFLTSVVGVFFYSILPAPAEYQPRRIGRWVSCSALAALRVCTSARVCKNSCRKRSSSSCSGS